MHVLSFLNHPVDRGVRSASRPSHFSLPSGGKSPAPSVGGLQGRSGQGSKRESLLQPPGFEPLKSERVAIPTAMPDRAEQVSNFH